jgi:hypothetical protein
MRSDGRGQAWKGLVMTMMCLRQCYPGVRESGRDQQGGLGSECTLQAAGHSNGCLVVGGCRRGGGGEVLL